MFPRSTLVAFLAFLLSAYAFPSYHNHQQPKQHGTITPVFTLGARSPQQTPKQGGVNSALGSKVKVPATSSKGPTTSTSVGNIKANNRQTATTSSSAAPISSGKNDGTVSNNKNTGTEGNKNSGNNGGSKNNGDPQKSLTLDPRVIAKGFANNGQDVPVDGQVASLTSTNNFINFCLTVPNLPITNGKQITSGSCNPVIMGMIPSVDKMPSSKFAFPKNFGTIKAGETFTIEMAIRNMETGFFVNAQANYFAAPQTLNGGGQIKGHSHVVIEQLDSVDQTKPTNPKQFVFFKGLNSRAQNGKLTATVDKGLQPGVYRLSSINTSSNHQPAIVPVAQHGSLDDSIYFTVTADGKPVQGGKNAASPSVRASSTTSSLVATKSAVKGVSTGSAAPISTSRSSSQAVATKSAGKGDAASVPTSSPTAGRKDKENISTSVPTVKATTISSATASPTARRSRRSMMNRL
jgi:hypothetical protein